MKIIKHHYSGKNKEFTIKEAVDDASTCDPYSYDGQLEKIKGDNDKLHELVARLVETMYDGEKISMRDTERVKYILGYGYEVEE